MNTKNALLMYSRGDIDAEAVLSTLKKVPSTPPIHDVLRDDETPYPRADTWEEVEAEYLADRLSPAKYHELWEAHQRG